jgi:hypothetical protein
VVADQLAHYRTLQELVEAYFGAEQHAAVEQASQLADGRILNEDTVEDAAYWERWLTIQGDQGDDRTDGGEGD